MDTLRVARLRARYRLPAGEPEGRARLDGLLRRALQEALEPALAAAGVPAHGELCLRAVAAPARLRLAEPDAALAAGWARAIAGAVREALDAGGPGVVRFSSLSHALVDVVQGVASGELGRAWAWRQLGVWSDGPPVSATVRALCGRPALVVPVLAEAARSGALVRLAPRFSAGEWRRLAAVALEAGGGVDVGPVTARSGGIAAGAGAPRRDSSAGRAEEPRSAPALPSSPDASDAILRASRIAAAAVRSGVVDDPGVRRAVAVLALLEVDPAAASSPPDRLSRRVDALEAAISGARTGVDPTSHAPRTERVEHRGSTHVSSTTGRADGLVDRTSTATQAVQRTAHALSDGTDPRDGQETARTQEPPAARAVPDPAAATGADEETGPPRPVRARGETRWGGLLFLLHLTDRVAEWVAASPPLAARPHRWTRHALARALLPLDERDPAALAFAGLPPDHPPPGRGEPPATPEESAELARLAAALADALRARLAPGDPRADVLVETCRRTAVVEADPGWFDVLLRHQEVTLDVRRAGLDLDPGWIPALGVAVRFHYG